MNVSRNSSQSSYSPLNAAISMTGSLTPHELLSATLSAWIELTSEALSGDALMLTERNFLALPIILKNSDSKVSRASYSNWVSAEISSISDWISLNSSKRVLQWSNRC